MKIKKEISWLAIKEHMSHNKFLDCLDIYDKYNIQIYDGIIQDLEKCEEPSFETFEYLARFAFYNTNIDTICQYVGSYTNITKNENLLNNFACKFILEIFRASVTIEVQESYAVTPAHDEVIAGVTLNKNIAGVTLNKNITGVTLNEDTTGVTLNEDTTGVTLNEEDIYLVEE